MSPPKASKYHLDFFIRLRDAMLESSSRGVGELSRSALPAGLACEVLDDAFKLLKAEPTMLELSFQDPLMEVVVVGDTHGQFHDVCHMIEIVGMPGVARTYIFNGDYVDRGAWGMELLALLAALKLCFPNRVYLLRGNHESSTCTKWYGFKGEVDAKYSYLSFPIAGAGTGGITAAQGAATAVEGGLGSVVTDSGLVAGGTAQEEPEAFKHPLVEEVATTPCLAMPVLKPHPDARAVYHSCKKMFSALPLAAVVQGKTLILHGGLFRKPRKGGGAKKHRGGRQVPGNLELGTLADLRGSNKGGLDPDGTGSSVVAADVLWSDPVGAPGLSSNDARGVGLTFGPDITQAFLEANSLSLVLRSHEGPDARDKRTDLPQVLMGYSIDHETPAGRLATIFSAPDYPQFQDSETRFNNQGAVAILRPPDFCHPDFKSFSAFQPRPASLAFYNYLIYADTDEEIGSEGGISEGGASEVKVSLSEGGMTEDPAVSEILLAQFVTGRKENEHILPSHRIAASHQTETRSSPPSLAPPLPLPLPQFSEPSQDQDKEERPLLPDPLSSLPSPSPMRNDIPPSNRLQEQEILNQEEKRSESSPVSKKPRLYEFNMDPSMSQ